MIHWTSLLVAPSSVISDGMATLRIVLSITMIKQAHAEHAEDEPPSLEHAGIDLVVGLGVGGAVVPSRIRSRLLFSKRNGSVS